MAMTRQDFDYAATIVKAMSDDPVRQMIVVEAYIDVFINSNPRFRVADFLAASGVTEKRWTEERVYRNLNIVAVK